VNVQLPEGFALSKELIHALEVGSPIVALESAVITHGLPRPENLILARELEAEVLKNRAMPATVALLEGKIRIGLTSSQLETLASLTKTRKISLGVHRGVPFDISADLPQLGRSPVLVVCAGAKSILDLPATHEVLETQGVPVIGYQTDEFPAFYTRSSGLPVDLRVDTPEEAAQIAVSSWRAGLKSAVLLVAAPPEDAALPFEQMESAVHTALAEAEVKNIHGAETTPFLLQRISELTAGKSLQANLALLKNNARIAAIIAAAMSRLEQTKHRRV